MTVPTVHCASLTVPSHPDLCNCSIRVVGTVADFSRRRIAAENAYRVRSAAREETFSVPQEKKVAELKPRQVFASLSAFLGRKPQGMRQVLGVAA